VAVDCTDYTPDYEPDYESDSSLVDDDDLEKSLREILPSESHRKKVQNETLLDVLPETNAAIVG